MTGLGNWLWQAFFKCGIKMTFTGMHPPLIHQHCHPLYVTTLTKMVTDFLLNFHNFNGTIIRCHTKRVIWGCNQLMRWKKWKVFCCIKVASRGSDRASGAPGLLPLQVVTWSIKIVSKMNAKMEFSLVMQYIQKINRGWKIQCELI